MTYVNGERARPSAYSLRNRVIAAAVVSTFCASVWTRGCELGTRLVVVVGLRRTSPGAVVVRLRRTSPKPLMSGAQLARGNDVWRAPFAWAAFWLANSCLHFLQLLGVCTFLVCTPEVLVIYFCRIFLYNACESM